MPRFLEVLVSVSGSWGEWDQWSAVVPMRTQPLHLAHVNLLANLVERFSAVRVLIGNQPRSIDDPYSYEQRLAWWRLMQTSIGSPAWSSSAVRTAALTPNDFTATSSVFRRRTSWSCRATTRLRRSVDAPAPRPRQLHIAAARSRLPQRSPPPGRWRRPPARAGLRTGDRGRDVRPLVPPWVWDDLRRAT